MSDVYGPDDRPVPEGPLQHIFEYHAAGGSNYVIAKLRIYRRLYSRRAREYNLAIDANTTPVLSDPPDTVIESLLSYTLNFAWPVNQAAQAPAEPPFDVPPDQGLTEPVSGITGMPTLPGVSSFGAGLIAVGSPGAYGVTQNQSAGFEPCIRLQGSPGGTPPSAGVVPPPPSPETGIEPTTWGSTEIKVQLHDGGLISSVDPGPGGGVTLEEVSVNFSGLSYEDGQGRRYRAIQGAVRPRDWSAFNRSPPGSDNIISQKGASFGEVWILMQRQR